MGGELTESDGWGINKSDEWGPGNGADIAHIGSMVIYMVQ